MHLHHIENKSPIYFTVLDLVRFLLYSLHAAGPDDQGKARSSLLPQWVICTSSADTELSVSSPSVTARLTCHAGCTAKLRPL